MGKIGELYFNSGSPLYYGKYIGYEWSAYPTATLGISFDEPFKIKFAKSSGEWTYTSAHIIKKGTLRTAITSESRCLILYLLHGSSLHHYLDKHKLGKNIYADLSDCFNSKNIEQLKSMVKENMNLDEVNAVRDYITKLFMTHPLEKKPRDARIEYAVKKITSMVREDDEKIIVSKIADHVNLSLSRLQHLFKEHTGHTIQSFVQGLRTVKFFQTISNAKTLTEAAHMCGFTDSAHMNHVIKKLYGLTPSRYFSTSKSDYVEIKYLSDDLHLYLY